MKKIILGLMFSCSVTAFGQKSTLVQDFFSMASAKDKVLTLVSCDPGVNWGSQLNPELTIWQEGKTSLHFVFDDQINHTYLILSPAMNKINQGEQVVNEYGTTEFGTQIFNTRTNLTESDETSLSITNKEVLRKKVFLRGYVPYYQSSNSMLIKKIDSKMYSINLNNEGTCLYSL